MGVWQEIVDYTVPSNTTSVVLNDFGTITKNDFVKIVFTNVNATASQNVIRLFANNDTTLGNYHRQFLLGDGSSVGVNRVDNNVFSVVLASSTESNFAYLKLSENDKFNLFAQNTRANTSGLNVFFNYTTSTSSFTSGITSLTLSGATNSIGTGSRIQIYKLAAEKVADFVTTSNSTQVDIPTTGIFDPAIDKDSEYLLVSEIISNAASQNFQLFVNDNTTGSNYNFQAIIGNGSTASATRSTGANIGFLDAADDRSLSYNHIKLSNIGAFTNQNYELRFPGTSSVRLVNHFTSSTAENITSITKLNIVGGTSGIKAGSRFTLYKLYE